MSNKNQDTVSLLPAQKMKTFLITFLCIGAAFAVPVLPSGPQSEAPLWMRSGKWQGDIVLTAAQEAALHGGRNGLIDPNYRWPNRVIPYRLKEGDFSYSQAAIIHEYLQQYNTRTCVTVRNATSEDVDYVLVTREDTGCWSYVGRLGGQQQLNLQDNASGTCLIPGTVVHEFLHAAGFYHQQSATERDDYVEIVWDNIQKGMEYNFDKYDESFITEFGVEYDYQSVMHYEKYAFSSNGKPTIVVRKDPNAITGNNEGFTEKDITKLSRMYGCE